MCILGKYSVISCFIIELSVVSVGSSSSFQFVNPFLSNNIHKHDRDFLPLQEAAAAEYAAVTGRREEAAAEAAVQTRRREAAYPDTPRLLLLHRGNRPLLRPVAGTSRDIRPRNPACPPPSGRHLLGAGAEVWGGIPQNVGGRAGCSGLRRHYGRDLGVHQEEGSPVYPRLPLDILGNLGSWTGSPDWIYHRDKLDLDILPLLRNSR